MSILQEEREIMHWIYAHLIGDYIIQNDWMATNKKSSDLHCFIHVITYMIPFAFCGLRWWQFLLIAIQHFIGDRFDLVRDYCNMVGSSRFLDPPFYPWSYIIIDQIFHILWIAFVVSLVP